MNAIVTIDTTVTEETTEVFLTTTNIALHNTVYSSVLVDKYYTSGQELPYAISTVTTLGSSPSSVASTPLKTDLSTASTSALFDLASLSVQANTPPTNSGQVSSTSTTEADTSSILANPLQPERLHGSTMASKSVIGLSIGLPIGVFLIGLIIVAVFVYYRKRSYDEDDPPSKFQNWLLSVSDKSRKKPFLDLEPGSHERFGEDGHIKYKISRKEPPAPYFKAPYHTGVFSDPVENDTAIEKYLYSKPRTIPETKETKRKSNWVYESPLSRWFLSKSIFQQSPTGPTRDYSSSNRDIKTPTVQLRSFKLLNKVRRDEAPKPTTAYYSGIVTHNEDVWEPPVSTIPTPASQIAGTTAPQFSPFAMPPTIPHSVPGIRSYESTPKPSPDVTVMLPMNDSSSALEDTDINVKEKSSTGEELPIAKVIKSFHPRLLDEIRLDVGETVRVLAKHSDGWCLVEKCDPLAPHDKIDTESISDSNYLNDYRGIVPLMCLETI
ncbi:HCL638Wp [Eremothecium sinecaudum]|uniref:HCL638Wp n=1 Tax=Eremothecium sinecaudum TaxID=45286 RepID=A0A109UXU3_9SACH|nr:HCL638Wp [Eremothecium sinecaudum]AMD19513.1 HCL638Wp [Eremothecium sinecaudum]